MAVHLPTINDYLTRTTGLLALTTGTATRMVWTKNNAAIVSSNCAYAALDVWGAGDSEGGLFADTAASLSELYVQRPAGFFTDLNGAALSTGAWHHLCWTVSGNTHKLYLDGLLQGAPFSFDLSGAPTPAVTNLEVLGSDGFGGNTDHDVAYYRAWSGTALTQAQIQQEMLSSVPVITANLFQSNTLDGTYADQSGNGRAWTPVGSPSFTTGPTLPDNVDASNAIVIGTLPYSITLPKISPPGTLNPNVWFTYTAVTGDVVIGTWAFTSLASSNKPSVKIWYGTATALNQLDDIVDINDIVTNVPYSVPVTPGTQYFFEVINAGLDVAATAQLTFSAVAQPTETISRGDIMVNDETFGFPVVSLSSATGAVKRHKVFSAGESVDIQPDGLMLAEAVDYNQDPIGLQIWNADFELIASITYPASFHDEVRHIYTSPLGGWFVAAKGADTTHSTVVKVNEDGSFGATTWTISHGATTAFNLGMAVNSDETILYYAVTGAANVPVKRWDLVNNVALADLAAGVATYNVLQDILVLADDTIVVGYKKTSAVRDSYVLQYSTAGAVLKTFHVGSSTMAINRMCRALDDPESFWVWIYPQSAGGTIDGTNRYINVIVSDGSFATDFTVAQYERGVYAAAASATPSARFGPSFSCPMWIYTVTATPVVLPVVRNIRRARILPHQSDRQLRQFWSRLEIVLESGMGLTTGQGSDPQVMFRYSDDGGHKWSRQLTASAGKLGEFRRRVQYLMLGAPKDRVIEIAVSDPSKWALIDAIVDYEEEDA